MGSVTGLDVAGCQWLQYDYGSALMPPRPDSFTMWRYRRLMPVPDGPVQYPVARGRHAAAARARAAAGVGRPRRCGSRTRRGTRRRPTRTAPPPS